METIKRKERNVTFSYGENEVLHNISTTIKPQSFTAVIGPSGSGKTTLCQLIPRFRDVTGGNVRIGGADIRYMEMEELMKKVSMVFQKVYLFEDTILNNIRFGKPDATLEEVREAAKAARCDDFIMALPNGYDTMVEEGGSNLSGGEKQRISIARAVYKDAEIMIFDDTFSALDYKTDMLVRKSIKKKLKDKTVIIVAQRIGTIKDADKIIVLDEGKVVGSGTHAELLENCKIYQEIALSQLSKEEL